MRALLSSAQVRLQLEDALRLDLVGPFAHDTDYVAELLPEPPSRWYLTGFLVPTHAPEEQRYDQSQDEELDNEVIMGASPDEDPEPEKTSKLRQYFPSSLGVSVLLPADARQLLVTLSWGDYVALIDEDASGPRAKSTTWQRVQQEAELTVELPRLTRAKTLTVPVPGHPELKVAVNLRPINTTHSALYAKMPAGTVSASVFLINYRTPSKDNERKDEAFMFQAGMRLRLERGFVPRPNPRGQDDADDFDERLADLQYRDMAEFATGHNIATHARQLLIDGQPKCYDIETRWLPRAFVSRSSPNQLETVEVGMESLDALASQPDARALRAQLEPLVKAYGAWITQQAKAHAGLGQQRQEVLDQVIIDARFACERIQRGIEALEDPKLRRAFALTNRAMSSAARRQRDYAPDQQPQWRLFQLAFILMGLPACSDAAHPERQIVDLIYFPTGGGKTEAYLGLAAMTLLMRRLRHDGDVHGAGTSVIMRYTLRLLTLDQLARATTLICALELLRQQQPQELGHWPFEIGLWVGSAATPNRMGGQGKNQEESAYTRTTRFQKDSNQHPSPIPLEQCPWCQTKFNKDSFRLTPNIKHPTNLELRCVNRRCDFAPIHNRVLPIVAVDEPLYRRLPCFIIATVDKFANLPWVGQTGALFGKVQRYDDQGFYGPCDPATAGRALPHGELDPPDLIIQDELHLISGPLGTMVGLYETAIDALCNPDLLEDAPTQPRLPKIIASTATIRRAQRQCRALFGRQSVAIFPPPGPGLDDSFFAKSVHDQDQCRQYLGVAAQGRSLKVALLRTYLAMLAASQAIYEAQGGSALDTLNPADPYMTLLGYFGSLRELGGSRRIVEDEVLGRLTSYAARRRVNEPEGKQLYASRKLSFDALELTSRESTDKVAQAKQRLAATYDDEEARVDVALASNMISVGLDITRLGLMVVLGQPKSNAEYIQATSRVGRDPSRPGLVITLFNVHRPRDRSHYERFEAFHQAFYRDVEATSVTPFAPRALERGLVGVTVALARLGVSALTPPLGAKRLPQHLGLLQFVSRQLAERALNHRDHSAGHDNDTLRQEIYSKVKDLLDRWAKKADRPSPLQYQTEHPDSSQRLLYYPLDPHLKELPDEDRIFKAQRSLRSVEPSVNLWVKRLDDDNAQPHDTE